MGKYGNTEHWNVFLNDFEQLYHENNVCREVNGKDFSLQVLGI